MERDPLTERIIGCCFKVHSQLGPAFSERIYHQALKVAFDNEGLKYKTEREFQVEYLDTTVGKFGVDLVVEDRVIVEIKSLHGNFPLIFQHQLLSYLKASGLHTGMLVNFGNKSCQIKRLAW